MSQENINLGTISLIPTLLFSMYLCNKFIHSSYRSKPHYKMMTLHLIANILISCYRVLNYGNSLTPGNFVFYGLSIDVVLVAIAISNYQTLMIFSVLDSKLTQYKKLLVAILVIVAIVFGVKMALLIIDAFQLLNYTYTFDVGKALTVLVVAQDNLQNFYLTFLIYNSLHHKSKGRQAKMKVLMLISSCVAVTLFDWICYFVSDYLHRNSTLT